MSVFTTVIDRDQRGMAPDDVARDVGVSPDLVSAILGQAERLGMVDVVRLTSCAMCQPDALTTPDAQRPLACAACPIRPGASRSVRRRRRTEEPVNTETE